MDKLKSKRLLLIFLSTILVIIVAYGFYDMLASWLTKETLQSSVEISLLLQGDEADIYESPVNLTSKGTYELSIIGTKDTDGTYVGNDVDEGKMPEPSRKNYYDYVMPGVNIPKDPKVFITKKSGAPAYLYIEVFEHNFPEYFTEKGFEELGVNNPEQNPNEVKPVYYDLEEYWVPVYTEEGEHALGVNKGKLYVYYNTGEYFQQYSKIFSDDTDGYLDAATYLSSYIMKDESTGVGKIDKQQYYGTNEVKTVNGSPMDCPYFNILKNDTVYISERYIHPEHYSTLYSELAKKTGTVTKEGHDFGLYFFSYMASAKVDGAFASPLEAYAKAGFMGEEDYLMYLYEAKDENPENIPPERIVYVWEDHLWSEIKGRVEGESIHEAVQKYFGDSDPYKVVLMESLELESKIAVSTGSNFVLDMNGKTIENNIQTAGNFITIPSGSKVTIRGNGTINMGDSLGYMIMNNGNLTIENGNYIRNYDPHKNSSMAFNGCVQAGKGSLIIYDGYFDNGYWCVDELDYTDPSISTCLKYYKFSNEKNLLPLYDTKNGKGWLLHEDGTYLTIDSNLNLWKIQTDVNGHYVKEHIQDIDGEYLYEDDYAVYLKKNSDGKYYYVDKPERVLEYFEKTGYYYIDDGGNYEFATSKITKHSKDTDGTQLYKDQNGVLLKMNAQKKYYYVDYPERILQNYNKGYYYKNSNGSLVISTANVVASIYYVVEQLPDDTPVYVRVKDDNGNLVLNNEGKYELEKVESYDKVYGPEPRAVGITVGSAYKPDVAVFGGTFVVQNPAWGDELGCQQIYSESTVEILDDSEYNPQRFFNPYFQLYQSAGQNDLLHLQEIWQDESIPDGYTITESNTTYSYVDENGETKTIYVPVYTVHYSGEIPD